MFAGPNGSGKSTLKLLLPPRLQGVYLNPDDMQKEMAATGAYPLPVQAGITSGDGLLTHLKESTFLRTAMAESDVRKLGFAGGALLMNGVPANAYLASVVADFLRHSLLRAKQTFTFETVMSSPDKVAFLRKAATQGYRNYLYYIATDDPQINVSRVAARVVLGGHPVPVDKIISRYAKSLDLLLDAIRLTNRAYIFDNSGPHTEKTWIAEVTDGKEIEFKNDFIPAWFHKAVIAKLTQGPHEPHRTT